MALKFRRGTTAQQSGSLAFGEPYVNTTLGTLLIGGPTGDIVLSAGGTGSTGNFGAISGSGLDITGNANIAGNLTLGGNITIGDAGTDTISINADLSSSIIPDTTNVFDLGSPTKVYRNIYANKLSGSVLEITSGSNPEIRLFNKTTGIGYHIQNGDGGNFQIHNSNTNDLLFRFDSASLDYGNQDGRFYANVFVSKSVNAHQVFAESIVAGGFTGSLSGSVNGIGNVSTYSASVESKITNNSSSVHDTLYYPTTGLVASISASINQATASISSSISNILYWPTTGLVASISSSINQATASLSASFYDSIFGLNPNALSYSINLDLYGGFGNTGSFDKLSGSIYRNIYGDGGMNVGLSGSIASTQNMFSMSVATDTAALYNSSSALTISASSAKMTNDTQDGRLNAIESESGSYARTNSANTFTGTQTITGSLYVSQDLVVAGSSSIQNISSSNLVIGAAYVTLNTNTPAARYAGIQIMDSGSMGASGSFLYDSVQDEFIQVHKGNGLNVTSSHFVQGPQTYDDLGNELYLTNNKLVKGTGLEHIVDSNITDTGTLITLGSNTIVNGTIVASGTTLVSGSSQIDATVTTNWATGIKTQLNANNVVSGSSQVIGILGSLNTYTGSNDTTNTTQNTRLTALEVSASTALSTNNSQGVSVTNLNTFSGSALTRLSALEVETTNLEAFTSSINTTIKSKLDADGVISGSSQLTTTFDARYLNTGGDSVVSGSSQIAFSGVTGTVSNAQLANSTISGVALGGTLAALTIGTGLSGTSYNGSSLVTIANTGVTSITGTANQVVASAGTGGVTLSLPQSINSTATPTFGNLTINGTITATGDITAYFTSDKRHKNNIQLIPNALEKVSKLNGVTWEWNDDVNEVTKSTPKTGLIAQEVQEVLPQVVVERENGYLGLDYSKMMGLLVEAIKEQQIQIEQLKAQIGSK